MFEDKKGHMIVTCKPQTICIFWRCYDVT